MRRARDTYIGFLRLLFLVGMTDDLPSAARRSIFFDLFWNVKFFVAAK